MSPADSAQTTTAVRPWLHVGILAVLLTGLNAAKPMHMDDPAYLAYAAEFSKHALDPYDFEFGTPNVMAGIDLLVPPVMPYWLGLGIALWGDDPLVMKLWLFPLALLGVAALSLLFRRFAPGLANELLWLTVLSPALLPSFNCMLEVPVLALGLTALVLALRSIERGSWGLTILVGLVLGVATQTKYTAFVSVAAVAGVYGLCGHWRRGLVVVTLAVSMFVGWELWMGVTQGRSHFLVHVEQRQGRSLRRILHQLMPLVTQVGGLAPAVALVGLAALGRRLCSVALVALTMALGFTALACVPAEWTILIPGRGSRPWLTLSHVVYGLLCLFVWGAVVVLVRRLLDGAIAPDHQGDEARAAKPPSEHLPRRQPGVAHARSGARWEQILDRFLVLWLALEIAGVFALSPFPAARRVIGVVLVLTLIAGRLAVRHGAAVSRRGLLRGVAGFGVSLGLVVFTTDWFEARAAQRAADRVATADWGLAPGHEKWHLSWWGFNFYAEKAGLKPLTLNRRLPRPGDLVALQDISELRRALDEQQMVRLELLDTVTMGDAFPLRTVPNYYCGRTPLEHHGGGRVTIRVYRVVAPKAPTAVVALE